MRVLAATLGMINQPGRWPASVEIAMLFQPIEHEPASQLLRHRPPDRPTLECVGVQHKREIEPPLPAKKYVGYVRYSQAIRSSLWG